MSDCTAGVHEFHILKANYYKPTGQIGALGTATYEQTVTYSTLYCRKCGETREVRSNG